MSIFDFPDYRSFLTSRMNNMPKKGRGFKSGLAEHLGINSTLISQIFAKDKDFTLEQAKRITDYLGLQSMESDYFMLLIQIERAGTQDLKKYFQEKAEQLKKESLKISKRIKTEKKLTDLERSVFYSSKIYSSIHLYCSLGKGKTVEEIVKRFNISRARAQEVISFLLMAGLISDNNGTFQMLQKSTHVEKGSPFLLNHHMNWRITATEKAESLSDEEMMYTGNFSLSKKDFAKIREELVGVIQSVLKTVKDSPEEELANLNIDFFWM